MRTAYDVIIRPIITEQSMEDLDIKKYVFEVAKDAGKIEIKKAIEEIFDVKVIKVTTTTVSYTHLDVYKRQPRASARSARGRAAAAASRQARTHCARSRFDRAAGR